jgi:hypothetical protein
MVPSVRQITVQFKGLNLSSSVRAPVVSNLVISALTFLLPFAEFEECLQILAAASSSEGNVIVIVFVNG